MAPIKWPMAFLMMVSLVSATLVVAKPSATSSARTGPCTGASNAISNPGFANGELAPWDLIQGFNVNASIIKVREGPDDYALRLTAHGPNADGTLYAGNVGQHSICPATKYALYYEYRAIGNISGCSAMLSFANVGGGYAFKFIDFTNASHDQPFRRDEFIFDNGDATYYQFSISLFCEHTSPHHSVSLDMDSFELAALGSLDPANCPNHKVHIPNGNFESGVFGPWSFNGVTGNGTEIGVVYNENNPLGGKYNFRADFDNPMAHPDDIQGFNLVVKIPHFCAAYNYTLSFAYEWVQDNGPIPAKAQPGFVVHIFNGADIRIQPSKGWKRANFTFSSAESGTNGVGVYYDFSPFNRVTNKTTHFPTFALQLDDFKIEVANSS